MPYRITHEPDVIRVELTGALTASDLREVARDVAELERPLPVAPHRLVDMQGSFGAQFDFAAVLDVATERAKVVLPNRIKSALIAPDPVRYGFARMFQTFMKNAMITVAIFPTEERARAWLAEPGVAPPAAPWVPGNPPSPA